MSAGIFTTETDEYEPRITRVRLGGKRVGSITQAGPGTFRASRKYGSAEDIRRLTWCRSFDAALAWVCKQSTEAETNARAAAICAGPPAVG